MTFWEMPSSQQVVNVASVPHRSPFRYPGGKTWLIPKIRKWLRSQPQIPSVLIEPFAGGGIVGLTAAFERLVEHVVFVELDPQVAAVWETIFDGGADWLADRILSFEMTPGNAEKTLATTGGTVRDQAFRTILKNRTFHSGVLAPGATFMKNGENGKGLKSRWYAATLARRIRDIGDLKDRFTFICGDGIEVVEAHCKKKHSVFFVDPPYTAGGSTGKRAGSRLYSHHELDHARLFKAASDVVGDILMTYDDAPDVRDLAKEHDFIFECVAMKNSHHARMSELLIGRNLDWLAG